MQAVVRYQYGAPGVLQLVSRPNPQPLPHQVLVQVYATTINRTDCANLTAQPFIMRFFLGLGRPKQPVVGTDFAGTILAVGSNVTNFKVGDNVFGFHDMGLQSQAQLLAVDAQKITRMPAGRSHAFMAACAEAAHYAFYFLDKVRLQPGEHAMVYGASGAIGSAMVQMLQYRQVAVTAVCGTNGVAALQSMGVQNIIDYQATDFTATGQTYHYVFDAVGKSTFGQCKKLLKPRGIYISSEFGPYLQNPLLALVTPLLGGRQVRFPLPLSTQRSHAFIAKMVNQGCFTPLVDRTYTFQHIRQAYEYVLSGQKLGNVILQVQQH